MRTWIVWKLNYITEKHSQKVKLILKKRHRINLDQFHIHQVSKSKNKKLLKGASPNNGNTTKSRTAINLKPILAADT